MTWLDTNQYVMQAQPIEDESAILFVDMGMAEPERQNHDHEKRSDSEYVSNAILSVNPRTYTIARN